ncbi:TPA: hypothetical protein ACSE37_003978 [Acinetobacter baumannii]|uniref:hypothetical protein n=1 Tax=Acinetobacter thermotolerans TaxID=3151487 RepID=UPI00325A5919
MSNKFKWVFLYGGLGWGVPFACIMYVIREIEGKPMAFGSLPVFFIICIIGGMFFGAIILKYLLKNKYEKLNLRFEKLSQVLLAWIVIYSIYGLIIRFLLVPLNYNDTMGAKIFGWIIWAIVLYTSFRIFEKNKSSDKSI